MQASRSSTAPNGRLCRGVWWDVAPNGSTWQYIIYGSTKRHPRQYNAAVHGGAMCARRTSKYESGRQTKLTPHPPAASPQKCAVRCGQASIACLQRYRTMQSQPNNQSRRKTDAQRTCARSARPSTPIFVCRNVCGRTTASVRQHRCLYHSCFQVVVGSFDHVLARALCRVEIIRTCSQRANEDTASRKQVIATLMTRQGASIHTLRRSSGSVHGTCSSVWQAR